MPLSWDRAGETAMRSDQGAKSRGACLGGILTSLLFGANAAFAVDALTATDRQYLKSMGHEEHSYALEKATRGQQKHLHKLINNRKMTTQRKVDLINSYLTAIGVEAPLR
jgi:hypothetical protein